MLHRRAQKNAKNWNSNGHTREAVSAKPVSETV